MHRQSLGSPPSSKLHHHSNGAASGATLNKKEDDSHIIASEVDIHNPLKNIGNNDDDEEKKNKTQKSMMSHKANNNAQKLVVHLIPVLILLCILVLFLFSHAPFEKVLGELNNLEELPAATVDNRERIRQMVKIGDGEVLGIQSMRNLQADAYKKVDITKKYRLLLHRKIGDFKAASKQD